MRTKTSGVLPNLHLALMRYLSVRLAQLFNPWFAKMGLEWVQFPVQNISACELIARTASVAKPQRFALAVRRITALVGRVVNATSHTMVSPQAPRGDTTPQSLTSCPGQFLLQQTWSELCLLPALSRGTRVLVR